MGFECGADDRRAGSVFLNYTEKKKNVEIKWISLCPYNWIWCPDDHSGSRCKAKQIKSTRAVVKMHHAHCGLSFLFCVCIEIVTSQHNTLWSLINISEMTPDPWPFFLLGFGNNTKINLSEAALLFCLKSDCDNSINIVCNLWYHFSQLCVDCLFSPRWGEMFL